MKIKIEKTEKSYNEITINLPYYSKSENNMKFYKIISERELIEIKLYDFCTSISFYKDMNDLAFLSDIKECNEHDFIEAYNAANKKLNIHVYNN